MEWPFNYLFRVRMYMPKAVSTIVNGIGRTLNPLLETLSETDMVAGALISIGTMQDGDTKKVLIWSAWIVACLLICW